MMAWSSLAVIFMWSQFALCLLGAIGFGFQYKWAESWIWVCYAFANLGFVALAGGFK